MRHLISLVLLIGCVMLVKFIRENWDSIMNLLMWGFIVWIICFSLYVILNKSGK